MSEPIKVTKENASIRAIGYEIMGAASSMNMPPELRDDIDQSEAFFMTDMYIWAKHAHEHIVAAAENTNALQRALGDIAFELRKKGDHDLCDRINQLIR